MTELPAVPRVLFVCTGNAGRSQMAEALFRHLAGNGAIAESAGVAPWAHLHPMAVRVMAEHGLSLAGQHPKPAAGMVGRHYAVVVTIGDPARARLPDALRRQARGVHWDLGDPADADGTAESLDVFRSTADEIAARLPALLEELLTARAG